MDAVERKCSTQIEVGNAPGSHELQHGERTYGGAAQRTGELISDRASRNGMNPISAMLMANNTYRPRARIRAGAK